MAVARYLVPRNMAGTGSLWLIRLCSQEVFRARGRAAAAAAARLSSCAKTSVFPRQTRELAPTNFFWYLTHRDRITTVSVDTLHT